jgi:hypothetical protein
MFATAVAVFIFFFVLVVFYSAVDKVFPRFWDGCASWVVSLLAWLVLIAIVTAVLSVI